MNYFWYILFGLAPSIIWLLFFLRKDVHPESNRMILKIFLWGILITLPAILIQLGVYAQLKALNLPFTLFLFTFYLGGVALVEEGLKYLVIRDKILSDPEFDEPIDVMLYMIIVALGFAALENILVLFPLSKLSEIFTVSVVRFGGATFLHALCSGIIGYFLALSFFETKKRLKLFIIGFITGTSLHGLYNFSIISIGGSLKLIFPIIILISLAGFVFLGFKRIKKLKSICQLK